MIINGADKTILVLVFEDLFAMINSVEQAQCTLGEVPDFLLYQLDYYKVLLTVFQWIVGGLALLPNPHQLFYLDAVEIFSFI